MAVGPSSRLVEGLAGPAGAIRTRFGLVLLLLAFAGSGWWWTAREMGGMDSGPWTTLGSFGWFAGVWTVMMAAMMLPSVAPTVALYARMTRTPYAPVAFTAGYLMLWAAAGMLAFALAAGVHGLNAHALGWDRAGRPAAAATLLAAAAYEITPLKDICLGKCRSPLGFLLGAWRDGWSGGLRMGATNGAWCIGCCWALMAGLFALGVMSIVWMALVAGLIALEKTLPWRRTANYTTVAVLVALGVLLLAAPDAVPGLTQPRGSQMPSMSSPNG
ncbi:MAG TPA: DUF2182 domain-containing protein [Mycobacteriales bacterium]|jgi:predicted metal-binding membrane protein|nr:DUF2182 domain-containing protein [Mycobacteriales bacterium]